MNEDRISYEEGIQELEALVNALEAGEMTLDESFKAYERATKLKNALETLLDEGDKRILVLTSSGEEELDAEEVK